MSSEFLMVLIRIFLPEGKMIRDKRKQKDQTHH